MKIKTKIVGAISAISKFARSRLLERSSRIGLMALAGLVGVTLTPDMAELIITGIGSVTALIEMLVPDDAKERAETRAFSTELLSGLNDAYRDGKKNGLGEKGETLLEIKKNIKAVYEADASSRPLSQIKTTLSVAESVLNMYRALK